MNKKPALFILIAAMLTSCSTPEVNIVETEIIGQNQNNLETETIPQEQYTPVVTPSIEPTLTQEIETARTPEIEPVIEFEDVLEFEMRGAFDFFWEQANTDVDSPGYGLIRDRYPGSEGISSIAAVGFGLTAYLVGIDMEYVSYDEVYERVNRTMDTLLAMDVEEGFYYHFNSMNSGERAWNSEISSIDTAILMMGVVSVGEYFGGEIGTKAQQIYDRVNWPWFLDESRDMFYMAYSPENGFAGHWDFYAEQLMLYILAAGSNTYPIDDSPYYEFIRHFGEFGDGEPFIHSWFGSIFTYQFSHAWIDFRGTTDLEGVDWFENSVEATRAQVNFAIAMDAEYLTIGPNAWGLSACDGPGGYNGLYGAPPSGYDNQAHTVDDTVPPSGAIGSILFLPQESQQAMLYYYSFEELRGEYGFRDAFNLSEEWFATDVIGIDKGISILMLANFQNDLIHQIMMSNEQILNGLSILHITTGE